MNPFRSTGESGPEGLSHMAFFRWVDETRSKLLAASASGEEPLIEEVSRSGLSFNIAYSEHRDFWRTFSDGSWEPHTTEILDTQLDTSTTFIDVGAWIGPTTLYGAQRAGRTIAIEPDPAAFKELKTNVQINCGRGWSENVELIEAAAWPVKEKVRVSNSMRFGDSMTSTLLDSSQNSFLAESVNIEDLVQDDMQMARSIFVKMDIEGGEFQLIKSLKTLLAYDQLGLLLSLHPSLLSSALEARGVRNPIIRHALVCWQLALVLQRLRKLRLYALPLRRVSFMGVLARFLLLREQPKEILALAVSHH